MVIVLALEVVTYSTRVVELDHAMYLKDELDSGSQVLHVTTFREKQVLIPLALVLREVGEASFVTPLDDPVQPMIENVEPLETIEKIPMRRS